MTDEPQAVRFDGVAKRFAAAVTALDGVDLQIRRGELVVFLGPSGSGKTTLLRLVGGLDTPTGGRLTVLGTDPAAAGGRALRALRRRIGFVFQEFQLVGRLSALENACSGALGRLTGPRIGLASYPRRVRREAAEQLDRVGMAEHLFRRADSLSGGQQQRVALARALVQRPEILLADEPVASLDPVTADTVLRLIRDIAREERLTVLCSLHQVAPALSMAQRVIGLRAGRVVADVPAADVDGNALTRVYGA
ncbi:phosphonate ABC transporter ATP-binding protein [Solwaraspora sp. WMMB335]|uniref:phosphonate ABC transporter ATP-binding protein n=1 Tax=Solwaraspora sp. WMMB335 TaxID=3404118 RepID=UPI003B94F804